MKEFGDILALWSQLEAKGEPAILATVVKTNGSSYRLPGARLLLTRTGQRVGSISGGCLEDDLVKKAWWLTENGPIIRRYDTTPDGEIAAEYGLGCNGIIHVLLEQVTPGNAEILSLIRQARETRQPAVVAHSLSTPGKRIMVRDGINALHGDGFFVETLVPALRLLIFGAGDDAIPLVKLAKLLGWEPWVYDGRAHYARREKFPEAYAVSVREPGACDSSLPIDDWTAAVLMSHSYSQDLEMLKELSRYPLRYLGVLGPRKRALEMLAESGLERELKNRAFHSPMGLDIGADGPEQVALAVAAEIQASLNHRSGGLLRDRAGSIHAQSSEGGAVAVENAWVQSIVCA
ncbi:MAG TPA: XdhC/CoxI family protein [Bryobacteraceae bacterium]|jgi:xanthine/CO dehydrogenase XdhC/CoxF family maturation factor|nr:XdhC/CoxI family protein [Bryobacteraceae bacterium]